MDILEKQWFFGIFFAKSLDFFQKAGIINNADRTQPQFPGVAQFGSALEWGSRGREFDSRHSDQNWAECQRERRKSFDLRRFFCVQNKIQRNTCYTAMCCTAGVMISYCRVSSSAIQRVLQASLGIRQSPRGDSVTEPTLGPSGRQLRLNCWAKNRR